MLTNRGFTLIEVLIASTIFVSVLMMGMTTFTAVNRLSEQIASVEAATETSYFLTETVARELRSAVRVVQEETGSVLFTTNDSVSGQLVDHRFSTGPFLGEDQFQSCQERTCLSAMLDRASLLPAAFAVERFEMVPLDSDPVTVQVSFALLNLAIAPDDPYFRTEYQTTVTSRIVR